MATKHITTLLLLWLIAFASAQNTNNENSEVETRSYVEEEWTFEESKLAEEEQRLAEEADIRVHNFNCATIDAQTCLYDDNCRCNFSFYDGSGCRFWKDCDEDGECDMNVAC